MNESLTKNEYPKAEFDAIRAGEDGGNPNQLCAKFCTPEIWEQYKDTVSSGPAKWTLARAVNTGVQNKSSFVGCHAGDYESWDEFKDFFYPVIEGYHKGFSMEEGPKLEGTASERMDPAKITEELKVSTMTKIIGRCASISHI